MDVLAPGPDEEHPRRQVPPLPAPLHRHSVGALASRAAFPVTTSAFAIAWQGRSDRAASRPQPGPRQHLPLELVARRVASRLTRPNWNPGQGCHTAHRAVGTTVSFGPTATA